MNRTTWVDVAKGWAILLVVIGHSWRGMNAAGLLADAPAGLFHAIDSRIYAFHMPMFFLLSGLFLTPALVRMPVPAFLRSRLLRLIWPLILWTYVFALFKLMAGDLANAPITARDMAFLPVPGKWQFWFLWALFVLQVGLIALKPALSDTVFRRSALWGLLAGACLLQFVPLPQSLHYWTSSALRFLPYLALGMLIAEPGVPALRADRWGPVFLLVFTAVLVAVPTVRQAGLPPLILALTLCLTATGATIWAAARWTGAATVLAALGRLSMIIFLAHTIFAAGIRTGLLACGITGIIPHLLLGTLAGVIFPILLQKSAARIMPLRLLGV